VERACSAGRACPWETLGAGPPSICLGPRHRAGVDSAHPCPPPRCAQVGPASGSRYQFRPSGAVAAAAVHGGGGGGAGGAAGLLTAGGLAGGGAYARAGAAGGKVPVVAGSSTKPQPHLQPSPQQHMASSGGFSPQTASLPLAARSGARGGGGGGGYGLGASSAAGGLSPERRGGEYVYA
jgi:hypothetical protein